MSNLSKSERINLGLELLRFHSEPGERHTVEDIAAWCDCHPHAVEVIERKAMKKLRSALKRAGLGRAELEKA